MIILKILLLNIPIGNEDTKRSLPPQTQKSKFHICFERFLNQSQRPFRIFISDWYNYLASTIASQTTNPTPHTPTSHPAFQILYLRASVTFHYPHIDSHPSYF